MIDNTSLGNKVGGGSLNFGFIAGTGSFQKCTIVTIKIINRKL
jgi:hypothetical protein